jgi:hypothetical protein
MNILYDAYRFVSRFLDYLLFESYLFLILQFFWFCDYFAEMGPAKLEHAGSLFECDLPNRVLYEDNLNI